jgi:hypothetical protein
LKTFYGHTKAVEFGPRALKAVRHRMMKRGNVRTTIDKNIGRIKNVFRWAVSEELIPPAVHQALAAAQRENVWDLLDLAFGNIAEVGVEMLIRGQLAMRTRMEALTQRRGAEKFPDVHEKAERVERIARFILDSAVQYSKVRHVSSLVNSTQPRRVQ